MKNRVILFLGLIGIIASLNCQYGTESNCLSAGCLWTTNSTCAVGSGICLDGQAFYTSLQQCVKCSTLGSTNCSQICSQYYFSTSSRTCVSCSNLNTNCLTCSNTQCFSCATGFSVDGNHITECLIDKCKIRYCTSCDNDTACYLCQNGYIPATNGTCSISSCKVSNCLYCLDDVTCVTCISGYQLNAAATACTLICSDPFCSSCLTATSCTNCFTGYYFNRNTGYCKLTCLLNKCVDCDLSTTCTKCDTNYQVNAARTACIPICTDTNCATCTTPTSCTSCNTGYYLETNGVCTRAICVIDNCLTCSTMTTCGTCSALATPGANNQSCVLTCLLSSSNANCADCKDLTTCSNCNPGYSLNSTTKLCNPVCPVDNCAICLTTALCSICKTGYKASTDGSTCILNCGISNCQTCQTTTTCKKCVGVYSLSTDAITCSLVCSPGLYPDTASSSCLFCTTNITGCGTCSVSKSVLICQSCYDLYYLTSSGSCESCSSKITNCLFCLGPNSCTSCSIGFNLVYLDSKYSCALPYACNVSQCAECASSNPKLCTTCSSGYYLTNSGSSCTLISCLTSQYFDGTTQSCKCPSGTLLINQACTTCNFAECTECNSGGCIACNARYYANQGVCDSCMAFCINCNSKEVCIKCDYGYKKQDGVCVSSERGLGSTKVSSEATSNSTNSSSGSNTTISIVVCPASCDTCAYYQGAIYCTLPMSGYAINQYGNVIKCNDNCATCASLNAEVCTSCYGASALISGDCIGCSDQYALTCPKNLNYAATCQIGYVAVSGVCRKCADNCISCAIKGPEKCDTLGCASGYINVVNTDICTKCFSSCATCVRYNPGICSSCGTSSFLSNSSSCVPCPTTCLSCTSDTVCTSCPIGNRLDSSWCYTSIGYPCADQSKNLCTACYSGFSLISGTCVADATCNGTSTCLTCDKSYYLQKGKCLACKTSNTCDYCSPTTPTSCLTCIKGYYLKKSNSVCNKCVTGCTQCLSAKVCIAAQDGYYLEVDEQGDYTGFVDQCDGSCSTCSAYNECDTCATDYVKLGVTCIYYRYITSRVTLGPVKSGGSSSWFKKDQSTDTTTAYAFLNTIQVAQALATAANIALSKITLQSLTSGSIRVTATIQTDQNTDLTAFEQNYNNNLPLMTDFQYVQSSNVVNGFTAQSTANVGLLLGITIPLLILIIVIVIAVKIRLDNSEQKTTEETEKEIQQLQM